MRSHYVLALGAAVGAMLMLAFSSLRAAPARPAPAYVIAEVEVTDPKVFQEYAAQVPATIRSAGGHYLVRGGPTVSLEGAAPKRIVVIGFDSASQAQAWYASPAYVAIRGIRQRSAHTRAFIIEGVAPNGEAK
ncbi:MAG TPA: DUF1330 domain-containing protein [Steroidobacteraceae bacterium]|nr:DUF1330 domain-containing protein [Steroidobacteraceae bacterium]